MANQGNRNSNTLREEAKQLYRQNDNIRRKWLDQYGSVSRDNAYQQNRVCLSELFNMLDIVMEICIEDFRRTHTILSIENGDRGTVYTFAGDDGSQVRFNAPNTFALRVRALRAIGYDISDELFYDTRILRNETTHGNQTVVLQHIELGYEKTLKALNSIADTLIILGKLDESLRTPTFEMMRIHEGDTLHNGAFLIGPLVGEGGMSRVYKATQKRTGRTLAVKEMKPGNYSEELIRREGDLLMLLHHQQIPQVHDTFFENGTYYIVMDYIEGVTLERFIESRSMSADAFFSDNNTEDFSNSSDSPDISVAEALMSDKERREFIRALLDVLSYLHSPEVGLVFTDLSPDNIIVDENVLPHLIDFGLAGRLGAEQVVPAATIGYAAPEVLAKGSLDERTDIYSFGYVLRYLYTGLSPLERTEEPLTDLITQPEIATVINKCISQNPNDRFANITELIDTLFPEGLPVQNSSFFSRHKKTAVILGLSAALCFSVLYYQNARHITTLSEESAATEIENAELKSELNQYNIQQLSFEQSGLTDHLMDWNDPALEEKMRTLMERPTGDLCLKDVWNYIMTSGTPGCLNLSNSGIKDISALSELLNLRDLALNDNFITDASPLSGLINLTSLRLDNNQIEDLTFADGLTELKSLSINGNKGIQTLSPLAALSLNELYLNETSPKDPEQLTHIKGLQKLSMEYCNLSDISWLTSMTSLTTLDLCENSITDLSGISELKQLGHLELDGNPLENTALSAISGLSDLTELSIRNCSLSSLSGLNSLKRLISLDASSNPVSDLSPLSELTEIEDLNVSEAALTGSLDAISEFVSLSRLDLHSNKITDISALAKLDQLSDLDLSNNCISDFSSIEGRKFDNRRIEGQRTVS